MKTIYSPNEILALIDINPPYFAFNEILKDADFLYAEVKPEQPLGLEAGPISAAEASRHLAILGVCSCAIENPVKKKHYYLAYKGEYERSNTELIFDYSTLTARATCISVNRKKGEAFTELLDANGMVIITLKVFYHVISDNTFLRLYNIYYKENPNFIFENPYKISHPFLEETISEKSITCNMGKIPDFYCAGHFPNIPALPVAILVYNLFHMASKLFNSNSGAKTIIRRYEINADNLAFSGDHVELNVKKMEKRDVNEMELLAEGIANKEKSVGRISLSIEQAKTEEAEPIYYKENLIAK